jgi:hypothetical protein
MDAFEPIEDIKLIGVLARKGAQSEIRILLLFPSLVAKIT